jgi:hypothetical protein
VSVCADHVAHGLGHAGLDAGVELPDVKAHLRDSLLFGDRRAQLGPDALPVGGEKMLAGDSARCKTFDKRSVPDRQRLALAQPCVDHGRLHTQVARELHLAAMRLCEPVFEFFHADDY